MHEYSLARSVLKFCDDELQKYPGRSIRETILLIGIMSGVEVHLLERALDQLKQNGVHENVKFTFEVDPLLISCRECEKDHPVFEFALKCPACGKEDVELKGGRELLIKSIIFENIL